MKNNLTGFGRLYSSANKTRYYNQEMGGLGFSFTDFLDDPKAALSAEVKSIETKISDYSQDVLGDKLYEKASTLIKVEGDKLVSSAQDAVIAKVGEYTSQKDVQDSAITGGVNAMATQVSQTLINVKDVYRTGGIGGLFKKYPVPFYIGGGVSALILARFVLGGKKKYVVAPNPKKKTRRKKK